MRRANFGAQISARNSGAQCFGRDTLLTRRTLHRYVPISELHHAQAMLEEERLALQRSEETCAAVERAAADQAAASAAAAVAAEEARREAAAKAAADLARAQEAVAAAQRRETEAREAAEEAAAASAAVRAESERQAELCASVTARQATAIKVRARLGRSCLRATPACSLATHHHHPSPRAPHLPYYRCSERRTLHSSRLSPASPPCDSKSPTARAANANAPSDLRRCLV